MNNKEFISALAHKSGFSATDTQGMVNTVIDAMSKSFENGDQVVVPAFGTFDVKKRLERVMVSPTTGQRMLVPPKLVLNFKPIASVKERLKKGGDE